MKKILIFLISALFFVSPVFCQLSNITIKYYGTFSLKIISSECQGQVLLGLSDTIDNSYPRTCVIKARKDSDLVMEFVILDDSEQKIWPRAEICKHIGAQDSTVEITDSDVKMLALYETAPTTMKLAAKNYQLFIGDSKLLASRIFPLPIGKSYLQIAYRDSNGIFYPRAFLPVSVSGIGNNIAITSENLDNTIKVSNW